MTAKPMSEHDRRKSLPPRIHGPRRVGTTAGSRGRIGSGWRRGRSRRGVVVGAAVAVVLVPGLILIPGPLAGGGGSAPSFGGRAAFAQSSPAKTPSARRRSSSKANRPGLEYDLFRREIEIQVAAKREQQISGLKRLLELGPDEGDIPDLKFRLAELYYEKSLFYFLRGQEAEHAALTAADRSVKAKKETARRENMRASKRWLQRALELYREIRETYPKYERGPEVLFALGQSYWSQDRYDEAVDAYRDLISRFPKSPLVSEAWIAFGEYYFTRGNVYRALKSYEKAATDKRSRVYGFALYKQAWCYYNLAEWKKALRLFRGTVFYSQLADQLSGENRIALGREAQKDWVRTYSHTGHPQEAETKIADLIGVSDCTGKDCRDLLEQLGAVWFDEGYFDEAAYVYKRVIGLAPQAVRNPYLQARVVDLVSRSGDKARVLAETKRLTAIYERQRTIVESRPLTDLEEADLEEGELLAESTTRQLAQQWNLEANKTKNERTFDAAQVMYNAYLALFSDSPNAYPLRFQLADLYYKVEKFDLAASAYEATVLADPKGKFVAEAANDGILAIEEHIRDLGLESPKPTDAEPVPLHPQKQRLVEACDRYVKYVAADRSGRFVAVKFKAGKIMYDHNQHDEALRRLDDVVMSHPRSEQAVFAANLVVDIHNLREDWDGLYRSASSYLKNEPLLDGRDKLAADLTQFGEYAKFKVVQRLDAEAQKGNGTPEMVAQAYEDFTAEFPASANADKALFNASVAWDRAGRLERADGLRRQLLKQYPNSPLVAEVGLYVAKQAAARADYEVAARAYSRFAEKFPDDERARDALYNAAVFYGGLGKVKAASRLRSQYLKKFGRITGGESAAADLHWSIARDLERAGRYKSAADQYRDYAKVFPATERFWEALWREADLRARQLRQGSTAAKIRRRLLGLFLGLRRKGRPLSDEARRYASWAAFERVEPDFVAYAKMRLVPPSLRRPKPFRRSLQKKAQLRDRVVAEYTRVVGEFQQAESSIASLYQVARTWEIFVESVLDLPCPEGLDDETCGELKARLEQETLPARDAALEAYRTCVERSTKLGTFTPYAQRCVRALETRAPDEYPELLEKTLPFTGGARIAPLEPRLLIFGQAASRGTP